MSSVAPQHTGAEIGVFGGSKGGGADCVPVFSGPNPSEPGAVRKFRQRSSSTGDLADQLMR